MLSVSRSVLVGALLGALLASCAGLAEWLDQPAEQGAPIDAGGGVGVVLPPAPEGEIEQELPGGGRVIVQPAPSPAPGTRGEAIVDGVAGLVGGINPMLGFGALAGGRLLLGALTRRRGPAAVPPAS